MKKQRKHYVFMAIIMLITALVATFKFNTKSGPYWLIPYFFGFVGGGYIYAAIKTNH
jgi:hypothetical protein